MEEKLKLNFLAGVQVGSDIYFSAWSRNGLFQYNPKLDRCDFLKIFKGEENWGVHSQALLYENTIWFIPRASERIAIVDLTSLDITYLALPEYGHRPKGHIPPIRMRGYHETGEKFLYLIPFTYKLFIKINMDEKKLVYVENWGGDEYAYAVGVRNQDKLITYINSCNEMRIIDVLSDTCIQKKIGNREIKYLGIQNLGEFILLFPAHLKDGIVLLNKKDGEVTTIQLDDNKQWYYEYQAIIKDNDILLVPYDGTKSVRISIEDGRSYIKQFKDLRVQDKAYCSSKIIYNDEIWFLSHVLDNPIIYYDKQKDDIEYHHIEMSQRKYDEDVIECIARYSIECSPLSGIKVLYENNHFSLSTFARFIEKQKNSEDTVTGIQIGREIYKSIK